MTKRDVEHDDFTEPPKGSRQTLLLQAEEIAQARSAQMPEMLEPFSPERARQLLHELRVHQIELEMQNDELRRTQEELEASRVRFFDLYDLAPVGYFTLSEEGIILEANLTVAILLGVGRGALVKQPLSRFILPEDQDIYYWHRKQLLETGAPQVCEFRMLRAGSPPFQAWLKASAARDAAGALICRVVVTDITERKLLEDAQTFLLHCGYPGSSENFFQSLARYLAQSLGMDYVCIDKLEGNGLDAQTVAVFNDGMFEDNVVYTLKDTPCGDVVGKTICCFPKDVRRLFPHDAALQQLMAESYVGTTLWSFDGEPIGLIAVIGRKPMMKTGLAESMLKLVAVRAAGELERMRAEEALLRTSHELNERVKELNCLYSFSKLIEQPGISASEICEGLVNLIPAGWQYPEVAAARLFLDNQIFQTANFAVTSWKQSSDILVDRKNVGRLQVCYLVEKPESDEGPFLKEERNLINELASRLGKTLQRIHAERERELLVNELESLVDVRTSDLVKANQELSDEIKERKNVQELLQFERQQLNNILETMNNGVFLVSPDHEIQYVNPTIRREFGPIDGKKCYEYFYERTDACPWCNNKAVFTGETVRWETIPPKTGRIYEIFDSRFRNEDGTFSKLSILHDITERQQALQALKESELKYRNLIETMNEGLALQDENGILTFVNDTLCKMVGYSREEIIGQSTISFYAGNDRKIYEEQMKNRMQGSDLPYEFTCRHKEGRKLHMLVYPKSLFNEEGKIVGSFGLLTDITERRHAEETLQESEKQLRILSAQLLNIQEAERSRISRELHDQLGQDLAVTKLLMRSIENKLPADPAVAKEECESVLSFVDQIIENVRRLSRDLSPAILEDLGLTAALRRMFNTYRANSPIQIQSELIDVDSLVPKEGHIMIYRVLQESLNNVIKHAEAKEVWVTVGMDDGKLSFVVADDGRGFEMNPADASTGPEVGLGLRILHERARILGGTLEITSQPGEGTRVTLRLPVEKNS